MAETKAAMEVDQMLNSLKWGDERPQEERKEVSISFPKGCAKEFTGKGGKEYMRISIPMDQAQDSNKAWPSFVLPAEQVKENDSGKSLWAKIAKDGKRRPETGDEEKYYGKSMACGTINLYGGINIKKLPFL